MFKEVSVLIPYQPDGGPRDEAFRWIRDFYGMMMPEAQLCVGELEGETFSRSRSINLAAAHAERNVYVIADADIIYDPGLIAKSMEWLANGRWVIPFSYMNRLSETYSKRLLERPAEWPIQMEVDTLPSHAAYFVGGLNVLTRDFFEKVGGYDERFIGWGGEDDAFAHSLDTLAGEHVRLEGEIIHFWHPFVGPEGNPHYASNYKLYDRYKAAKGKMEEMGRLIGERAEKDERKGETRP